jgi:DNA adenine methylase
VKPPFSYFGGKVGMSRRIVEMLPPHRVYIEPFFGSGAVLFAKRPAAIEVVNDVDGVLVTFFRVMREQPEQLAEACRMTPYARDEYERADLEAEDLPDLEVARRFWVRVNQSFSKTAGNRTGWSLTTARSQAAPVSMQSRIDRFESCAARLASVSIENCDAAGLIDRVGQSADTCVYADPPYLGSTRVNAGRGDVGDYRRDMPREESHERLAEALHGTEATVLLSGYPSALYDTLYSDWHHVDFEVLTHSSNAVTTSRGGRIERVWSNRPLNVAQGRLEFTEESA